MQNTRVSQLGHLLQVVVSAGAHSRTLASREVCFRVLGQAAHHLAAALLINGSCSQIRTLRQLSVKHFRH